MIRARILTPWGQTGSIRVPQVALDHAVKSWTDVTGQPAANVPPSPNLFTVEVLCEQAVHDEIAADPAYTILWSEEL